MLRYIAIFAIFLRKAMASGECADKSPYCNLNDCAVRPGYAIEYCKRTCGNCEKFCQNSQFVSCRDERKSECDSMLKDYCPLLCGVCTQPKNTTKKMTTTTTETVPSTTISSTTPKIVLPFSSSNSFHNHAPVIPQLNSAPLVTTNVSLLAEQVATAKPYAVPPVFRSVDLRRAPLHQIATNELDVTALPLNIDDADEIEWQHRPDEPEPRLANDTFNPYSPELPEPQPVWTSVLVPKRRNNNIRGGSVPTINSINENLNSNNANNFNNMNHMNMNGMNNQMGNQMIGQANGNVNRGPDFYSAYNSYGAQSNFNVRRAPQYGNRNTYFGNMPWMNQMGQIGQMGQMGQMNQMNQMNQNRNNFLRPTTENPLAIAELITLLGCRDKDVSTCSKITEEACYARPGFYLRLCPVKCKNCNGLQCYDSVKVDCEEVKRLGGCKLPTASEYCPKTCALCPTPAALTDSLSICKDELDTCENLAQTGICDHAFSRRALRMYCAKSCGFCRPVQYYMNDGLAEKKFYSPRRESTRKTTALGHLRRTKKRNYLF